MTQVAKCAACTEQIEELENHNEDLEQENEKLKEEVVNRNTIKQLQHDHEQKLHQMQTQIDVYKKRADELEAKMQFKKAKIDELFMDC